MDKEIKEILPGCKKYLQQTNEEARPKYYKLMGKSHMDDKQWEIMQETRDLLVKIDSLLGPDDENFSQDSCKYGFMTNEFKDTKYPTITLTAEMNGKWVNIKLLDYGLAEIDLTKEDARRLGEYLIALSK